MFHFIPAHHKRIAPVFDLHTQKTDLWAKHNSVVDSGSISENRLKFLDIKLNCEIHSPCSGVGI